jgi:hypothetical protein
MTDIVSPVAVAWRRRHLDQRPTPFRGCGRSRAPRAQAANCHRRRRFRRRGRGAGTTEEQWRSRFDRPPQSSHFSAAALSGGNCGPLAFRRGGADSAACPQAEEFVGDAGRSNRPRPELSNCHHQLRGSRDQARRLRLSDPGAGNAGELFRTSSRSTRRVSKPSPTARPSARKFSPRSSWQSWPMNQASVPGGCVSCWSARDQPASSLRHRLRR